MTNRTVVVLFQVPGRCKIWQWGCCICNPCSIYAPFILREGEDERLAKTSMALPLLCEVMLEALNCPMALLTLVDAAQQGLEGEQGHLRLRDRLWTVQWE